MKPQFTIHSGAGLIRSWDASVESPVDMANYSQSPAALHPALMVGYRGNQTEGWRRLDVGADFSFDGNDRGVRMTEEAGTAKEEEMFVGLWEIECQDQFYQGWRATLVFVGGRKGEGRYGTTDSLDRDPGMTSVLDTKERSEESIYPGDTDDIPGKPYVRSW